MWNYFFTEITYFEIFICSWSMGKMLLTATHTIFVSKSTVGITYEPLSLLMISNYIEHQKSAFFVLFFRSIATRFRRKIPCKNLEFINVWGEKIGPNLLTMEHLQKFVRKICFLMNLFVKFETFGTFLFRNIFDSLKLEFRNVIYSFLP